MRNLKSKILILTTFLFILGLFYKIDCYGKEINRLSIELRETQNYYESTINNLREQQKKLLSKNEIEQCKSKYKENYEDILLSEILGFDINNLDKVNKESWYYYNKLTDEQKAVYEKVMFNIIKQSSYTFTVPGFTKDNIWNFIKYIQYDHERIFWIDFSAPSTLQYSVTNDYYIINGQAYDGFETIEDIYLAWNDIKDYRDKALSNIESLNQNQIEKQIFNYIVTHTKYNIEASMGQSMYSTVKAETVCTGYSKMFKFLCNEAGLKCILAYGKCNANNVAHLWNLVMIDDEIYMVDCTTGLYSDNSGNVYVSYDYYNESISFMEEYYTLNDYFK